MERFPSADKKLDLRGGFYHAFFVVGIRLQKELAINWQPRETVDKFPVESATTENKDLNQLISIHHKNLNDIFNQNA
jgi:hypothetical protein